MADHRDDPPGRGDEPSYRVYRAGEDDPPGRDERPAGPPFRRPRRRAVGYHALPLEAAVHAASARTQTSGGRRRPSAAPRRGGRRPITVGRVVKWVALAIGAWLALSMVLFLVSAQIQKGKVSDSAKAALTDAGYPLWSANNILILGSDQRQKGSKEPGASTSGPSRSDSILLWRVGGGKSARLSIPRDTIVDIPGHGRQKINAAYAFGGAALSIDTIEAYLGVPINHLIEVDFDNFPKLIDALGGIDVTTGRVCSEISGGKANGGWTLNLKRGTHHLDGEQALVLARTRKNSCNPSEDDLTRAKRQQQILCGMKDQAFSPGTFFRLPWVSWAAPKAMRTDMGGPTLMGFFGAAAVGGTRRRACWDRRASRRCPTAAPASSSPRPTRRPPSSGSWTG